MIANRIAEKSGNGQTGWSATFAITGAIMLALYLYHRKAVPSPASDTSRTTNSIKDAFSNYGDIISSYFQKPGIWQALLFLLLFRFPEAQLAKMGKLFLMDSAAQGGLALDKGEIGLIYGVIGVIGLIIGGIVGGICISRKGLKYWLWPMVVAISLPDAVYIYMSSALPQDMTVISSCIFIEQLGYGFGFTAYTLYMIYFAQGKYPTAHFAISTAFMSLGMMLPGMFAGKLQESMGYENFFIWVTACTLITFIVSALVKIDPNFGKRQK
jgi:PAT family beta-lactamase induction signal transducer AmpG